MSFITYTLDKHSLDWCLRLAMRRSGSVGHRDTPNSRNMMKDKPPWWRHFIGVIGELAYSWFSGLPVDQKTIGRGDDGTDFPDGVQVKASDLAHTPNLMFLCSQWPRKVAAVYVLAWVRLSVPVQSVSLLGWMTREEIEKVAVTKDYGSGPTLVVHFNTLHPMDSLAAELEGVVR